MSIELLEKLIRAGEEGNLREVEITLDILEANPKFDVNQPSEEGKLLLVQIAGNFVSEVGSKRWWAKHLIVWRDADVNKTDSGGHSPLSRAAGLKEHQGLVKILLMYKADVDNKDGKIRPLVQAVKINDLEVAKKLVDAGADVNKTDSDGHSPLSAAAKEANQELVEFLLEKGADVDNKAGNEIPLMLAIIEGDLAAAKLLVGAGADINKTDSNGYSPLSKAVEEDSPELVKFLLESGADISQQDGEGDPPLLAAVRAGRLEMVKLLVANGAAVNQPGHSGTTPLMVAMENNSLEIAEFLLENGANDKLEDCVGETSVTDLSKEKTELVIQNMSADVGNEPDVGTSETSLFSTVKDLNDTSLPSVSS